MKIRYDWMDVENMCKIIAVIDFVSCGLVLDFIISIKSGWIISLSIDFSC